MDSQSVQKALENACETFQSLGIIGLRMNDISVRQAFGSKVYTVKQIESSIQSNNVVHSIRSQEIEVLKADDFIELIEQCMMPNNNKQFLDFNKKQCILTIFQSPQLAGLVLYDEVCHTLSQLGITEGKPKDTDFCKYSILDLKAIRILNRLNIYLKQTKITLEEFT